MSRAWLAAHPGGTHPRAMAAPAWLAARPASRTWAAAGGGGIRGARPGGGANGPLMRIPERGLDTMMPCTSSEAPASRPPPLPGCPSCVASAVGIWLACGPVGFEPKQSSFAGLHEHLAGLQWPQRRCSAWGDNLTKQCGRLIWRWWNGRRRRRAKLRRQWRGWSCSGT